MTATYINPKLINFASEVDAETITQAEQIAELPFVYPHVALMPDAHVGKGSSVGTVIPTRGAVIPAAVGVDIGCGMIATLTAFGEDDIAGRNLAELRDSIESAIPMSAGGYNKSLNRYPFTAPRIEYLEDLADRNRVNLSHSPKWREQLGTLGGGNHFIELCVDQHGRLWLFLHSGSRGVGNKIAQKHIKIAQAECAEHGVELPGGNKDLAYLVEGEPSFGAYLAELRWAQQFAMFNRNEMMDRYRQAFAHWLDIGVDEAPVVEIAGERVNAHHNYTTQEHINGELVWVTRKGAISAQLGERGLIPGSMGTASYVVTGKGNPEGLHSAPHGAGRRYSRTKARKLFTVDDLADRMRGIEYRHGEAWVDEIPDAYKPIDVVMHDAEDLVSVDVELRQIVNVKGQ
ncbi:RtcB-like RNA ligase [Mycobacterium phage OkiRoe]|uniref:tRNA splicing ligase n=1 Tax=Mycobacterium phage OkiRoe TaxID=1486473 RepID=UPI00045F72B7|nr:tRNA splicing ligase [Mycobacterium phage OkiRoe]AHZ95640.1 RtcB-like RNA ligase [Mycobacterium phage OkiRoe]